MTNIPPGTLKFKWFVMEDVVVEMLSDQQKHNAFGMKNKQKKILIGNSVSGNGNMFIL